MVSDAGILKYFSPGAGTAFVGRDEAEVTSDKYEGDSTDAIKDQRIRRRKLIKELSDQGVPRSGPASSLANLEANYLSSEQRANLEKELEADFRKVNYWHAVDEANGDEKSIEDIIDNVQEEIAAEKAAAEAKKEKARLPIVAMPPKLYQISVPETQATEAVVEKPEPSSVEPVAETIPEEEKPILTFQNLQTILNPFASKFGQVSAEEFENAYKEIASSASNNLMSVYSAMTKARTELMKRATGSFGDALVDIGRRINLGGGDAKRLKAELKKYSIGVEDVKSLATQFDEGLFETPFEEMIGKIYYFLRETAPESITDADLFEQVMQPLLERGYQESQDFGLIKAPRSQKKITKNSRLAHERKVKKHRKRLQGFEAQLDESKKDLYAFVVDKFNGYEHEKISSRLSELS